jgi:hypothetical protein
MAKDATLSRRVVMTTRSCIFTVYESIFLLYYAMFKVLLIVKSYQKNRFSPL